MMKSGEGQIRQPAEVDPFPTFGRDGKWVRPRRKHAVPGHVFAGADANQQRRVRNLRPAQQDREQEDRVTQHGVAADRFFFNEFRRERFPFGKLIFGRLCRRDAWSRWRSGLRAGSIVRGDRHKEFREKTETNEGRCMLRRALGGSNERPSSEWPSSRSRTPRGNHHGHRVETDLEARSKLAGPGSISTHGGFMLWEVEIQPREGEIDREGLRVLADAKALGIPSLGEVRSARSFLIEGNLAEADVHKLQPLLVDGVVETAFVRKLPAGKEAANDTTLLNVLFKPGVTDNVGHTAQEAIANLGVAVSSVATCRKYYITGKLAGEHLSRLGSKVLANDAIEHVVTGPLPLSSLAIGSDYQFKLVTVGIRSMSDNELMRLSKEGQLYLSLAEMQTIQSYV